MAGAGAGAQRVTEYPQTPPGWIVLDRRSVGPFTTAATYEDPDGRAVHWASRVHRKLDVPVANAATVSGALCFLVGAALLLPEGARSGSL